MERLLRVSSRQNDGMDGMTGMTQHIRTKLSQFINFINLILPVPLKVIVLYSIITNELNNSTTVDKHKHEQIFRTAVIIADTLKLSTLLILFPYEN
jgi:hypothetical protein